MRGADLPSRPGEMPVEPFRYYRYGERAVWVGWAEVRSRLLESGPTNC